MARGMNERIQKLRELSVTTPVHIDLERARIETDFCNSKNIISSKPNFINQILNNNFNTSIIFKSIFQRRHFIWETVS